MFDSSTHAFEAAGSFEGHESDDSRLHVHLTLTDPEVVAAARGYTDERARETFLVTALKIGVLSLHAASGVIDGGAIRQEGENLMAALSERLEGWRRSMESGVTSSLTHYFDPANGMFTERVNRLVRHDGELATVMRDQVNGAQQSLATVFDRFIGENSALLKALDPSGENQLVVTMKATLDGVVQAQNLAICTQFSLDEPTSALSRLVRELESKHGDLNEALGKRMSEVVAEFSLDREDSALSRLVGRVDQAQKAMTGEFSLDNKASAISRLHELIQTNHEKTMSAVNEVVQRLQATIDTLQVRRAEAARGTHHGLEFEADVARLLRAELESAGDMVHETGSTTGRISACKVGDHVVTLGHDSAATGARIVVECKQKAGVNLQDTLQEAQLARDNREAKICIFVHSEKTAHHSIPKFQRFGHDLVVRWNAEDDGSDLWLRAALMVAKALSVRAAKQEQGEAASFEEIDRAVLAIRKQIDGFDEITTCANTSVKAAGKIIERAEIMRKEISSRVSTLGSQLGNLRESTRSAD